MHIVCLAKGIVALRNEKGSYNVPGSGKTLMAIVALRNEKGSYNYGLPYNSTVTIVALRNEKGSYNARCCNIT